MATAGHAGPGWRPGQPGDVPGGPGTSWPGVLGRPGTSRVVLGRPRVSLGRPVMSPGRPWEVLGHPGDIPGLLLLIPWRMQLGKTSLYC